MKQKWSPNEGLFFSIGLIALFLSTHAGYTLEITLGILGVSILSLGQPIALRQAQAQNILPGKLLFSLLLSVVFCAVGTVGSIYLFKAVPATQGIPYIYLIAAGLILAIQCMEAHFRAIFLNEVAFVLDLLSGITLVLPALLPVSGEHMQWVLFCGEGVLAIVALILCVVLTERGGLLVSWVLLREIPTALFYSLYFPALCAFLMLILSTQKDVFPPEESILLGYLVGCALLCASRSIFRREAGENSSGKIALLVLLIAAAIGGVIALHQGAIEGADCVCFLAMALIAAGCAITLYEPATLPNAISEIMLIAFGLFLPLQKLLSSEIALIVLCGALAAINLLQYASWRALFRNIRLRRIRK